VTDLERFLRFEHEYRDGLHSYVIRADETDLPGPAWPGLWELDYPEEPDLNPWHRHAINNSDGEALAVWRALAWELTAGRSRFAIPAYYRDEAARFLGVDREAVRLVRWEYEVDVEQPEWLTADVGFVPARSCVPLRPAPDPWQWDHAGFAGLFELASFRHLTDLDLAVAGDASSELTLFALRDPGRADFLAAALNQADRPFLADILQPGDILRRPGRGSRPRYRRDQLPHRQGAWGHLRRSTSWPTTSVERFVATWTGQVRSIRSTSSIPRSTICSPRATPPVPPDGGLLAAPACHTRTAADVGVARLIRYARRREKDQARPPDAASGVGIVSDCEVVIV
jgi:hypothetical protein